MAKNVKNSLCVQSTKPQNPNPDYTLILKRYNFNLKSGIQKHIQCIHTEDSRIAPTAPVLDYMCQSCFCIKYSIIFCMGS